MTQRMTLRDAAAMAAKCPVCLAPIGDPCRSMNMRFPGAAADSVHRGRIAAAETDAALRPKGGATS